MYDPCSQARQLDFLTRSRADETRLQGSRHSHCLEFELGAADSEAKGSVSFSVVTELLDTGPAFLKQRKR